MLEEIKLDNWDEFERRAKQEMFTEIYASNIRYFMFRGQSNADWHLETTLERSIGKNLLAESYFNHIKQMQNKIETFANLRWELPTYDDFRKMIYDEQKIDEQTFFYMSYLRHFGFPTPLLDWSWSPFIAAYFAFRDVSNPAKEVAIYMCSLTSAIGFGVYISDEPSISPILTTPRNNKRHELQQGVYTICLRKKDEQIYFSNHEDGSLNTENSYPFGKKFILPASERVYALRALEAYNITPFSLFGTEESLLESLFLEKYNEAQTNKLRWEERIRQYPNEYDVDLNDVNSLW